MEHSQEYLQDLHNRTNKPRPQWWIDKITKAHENAIRTNNDDKQIIYMNLKETIKQLKTK